METESGEILWPIAEIIGSAVSRYSSISAVSSVLGVCIVLNAPLVSFDVMAHLFSNFRLRICADGGANAVLDTFRSIADPLSTFPFIPHLVVGDLDSIRDDVRSFFSDRGVEIRQVSDQSNTDLDKALLVAEATVGGSSPQFTAIVGSIGSHEGRIDQFFAVIQSMYMYRHSKQLRLVQVGNESILIVLTEGVHQVEMPASAIGKHCGLVPVFGRVERVVTSGLEWNLSQDLGPLAFGGLVSTNNIIRDAVVHVETSHPLLFTITYR
jgi:thiamine pyrophosphokinase